MKLNAAASSGRPGHPGAPQWPCIRFATLACSGLLAWSPTGGDVAAQDRSLTAGFPEVYRAGGLSAPEWAQFTNPSRMGFDAAGNLYVLDSGASRVVVIDRGGELVTTVGRAGEGPGEFRSASDIVVWRDGRFGVVDIGHAAYQLFTPDGELERFVRMSSASGELATAAARGKVRPDPAGGGVIAEGPGLGAMLASLLIRELAGGQVHVVGEEGKLERLDLRGEVAVSEPVAQTRIIPPGEADHLTFEPRVIWDVLPDGSLAYIDSTAYHISIVGSDGRPTRRLDRGLSPEAVTARIRRAVIEHELHEMDEELAQQREEMGERFAAVFSDEMLGELREVAENQEFYPEIPCCGDCGRPGTVPCGFSDGAKIPGMTPDRSMFSGRTADTAAPSRRETPECPGRSDRTAWLRSSRGTSWTCRPSW